MKHILILSLLTILSACNCGSSLKITPMQTSDKQLTCKDIILEINEAEFYHRSAKEDRRVEAAEVLMPLCWASDYFDSDEALRQANERIEYLTHIYELLDCGGQKFQPTNQAPGQAPGAIPFYPAPPPQQSKPGQTPPGVAPPTRQ